MERKKANRVLLAGTSSGCGKTTVTCGLLCALSKKMEVSAFKCGPDYIDPMFHKKVLGLPSYNIDSFFYEEEILKYLFLEKTKNLSFVEGVMGFYDGRAVNSLLGSSYDVSKLLKIPTILLVNGKGTAHSLLPVIQGFLQYREDHFIKGILLNQVSKTTFLQLKPLIEDLCGSQIAVLGYIPKLPEEFVLRSRHLGLVTPSELGNLREMMEQLGDLLCETVDIEKIVEIAQGAEDLQYENIQFPEVKETVNIAVAKDEAFSFYYEDNLELLEQLGAKLHYFSPLAEKTLPPEIDGLYLGGGYPELYLKQLANNSSMKQSILQFLQRNAPCIAECGGFLYLSKEIDGFPMVGFLDTSSEKGDKLGKFGYITLESCGKSMFPLGEKIKAHEFHYYQAKHSGEDFLAVKPNGKQWKVGFSSDTFYGGFPHLAFYSNVKIPKEFIKLCLEYKEKRKR